MKMGALSPALWILALYFRDYCDQNRRQLFCFVLERLQAF